jgi:prefoldin subunit 5
MNNTGFSLLMTCSASAGTGQATKSNAVSRGPLSHFLGEDDSTDEEVDPPVTTCSNSPTVPVSLIPPKPESPKSRDLLIRDPEVNIEPDANIINVTTQNETTKEDEFEQPRSPLPGSENPPIVLGIDWDSDEIWERRFLRVVFEDKRERQQQLQLIQQQRQQIAQIKQSIDEQKYGLEAREAKLAEVKPLVPSSKQLQSAGITFDLLVPYMMAINEKSALENVDLKTATYSVAKIIRECREVEGLRSAAERIKQQIANLDVLAEQKTHALTTIMNLQQIGMTEDEIGELVKVVGRWRLASHANLFQRRTRLLLY